MTNRKKRRARLTSNAKRQKNRARSASSRNCDPSIDLDRQLIALAVEKGDDQILANLTKVAREVAELQEALADSICFDFFQPEHIAQLTAEGHDLASGMFWRSFNLLLIYCIKTETAALSKLTDAVIWSTASENEIAIALSGRAIIEHAATTCTVARAIEPMCKRLKDEIWSSTERSLANETSPTDQDRKAHQELLRFAVGRRVQETPLPLSLPSRSAWADFNKSLQGVPDHLKSTHVMTDIDKMGIPALRSVYEFLSEYCHPNSASRGFDFVQQSTTASHRSLLHHGKASLIAITRLLKTVVPDVCEALLRSLSILNSARRPTPSDSPEMLREPFPGAVLISDDFGRLFWIDPEDVVLPEIDGIKLSPDQVKRAVAVYTTFRDFLGSETAEEWAIEFGKEGDPEGQIQSWERMAYVYNAELQVRGEVSEDLRAILFSVLLSSGEASSLAELRVVVPEFDRLPNGARVYQAMRGGSHYG